MSWNDKMPTSLKKLRQQTLISSRTATITLHSSFEKWKYITGKMVYQRKYVRMELLLCCSQVLPEDANYLKHQIMVKEHTVKSIAASIQCI